MKLLHNALLLLLGVLTLLAPKAYADSATVDVSQRLAEPISRITFQDANGTDIVSPLLHFPLRTASFICQDSSSGGKTFLSTERQKLAISVPDRASNGWDVSLAPTNGVAAGWTNSDNPTALAINDPNQGGCKSSDPLSGSFGGLMKIDPSDLTADGVCSQGCIDATTSPTKGAATDFAQTQSASLFHSDQPHIGWEGTLTGVSLSQTIPAGTPSGDYSLPLTLTLTEL